MGTTFHGYDDSRQADIAMLNSKLLDPNVPAESKKKIQDNLYAIKDQKGYKSLQKDRERLREATLNGDTDQVNRISDRMRDTYDKDYKLK